MKTTDLFTINGRQAVTLPDEFRFSGDRVTLRKEGDAVVLEPVRTSDWPDGFFEAIRIDDESFARPPQGAVPPLPSDIE